MTSDASNANKHKHLEFIQNVINRMARNSFMLKSLMALQVAALVAFQARGDGTGAATENSGDPALWIVFFAVLPFWYLDSYFLRQERLFRELYETVRKREEIEIDFSMNPNSANRKGVKGSMASLFASTLWPYYGIIGLILLLMLAIG